MKEIYNYFVECFRQGFFSSLSSGEGVFELGAEDYRNFPVLKNHSAVRVRIIAGGYAVELA